MVDPNVFEEVIISEVLIRSLPVVPTRNFEVVGDESTDALPHFFLSEFVLVGVHFSFLVLVLLRKIES